MTDDTNTPFPDWVEAELYGGSKGPMAISGLKRSQLGRCAPEGDGR